MGKKVLKTIDGNTAASYISYALSDVAALYPITPSSTMGEISDQWSAEGKKNIFGQQVSIMEMQSEAGAAGAIHGSLSGGALTTTYTASQGLLLMIPNMYKIAGELLPGVFHVSARSLATHSLSIYGDHSDVMAARQTGFAFVASANVQEILDLALVSHLSSIQSSIPFCHFFDGFRTSSEVSKVEMIDYEDIAKLVDYDAIRKFRDRGLRPEKPYMKVGAENPDVYFQHREKCNPYYNNIIKIIDDNFIKVSEITGRKYNFFDYVGAPDAEKIIICMGSSADVVEETITHLNQQGSKLGLIKVRIYRPWSADHLIKVIPDSAKSIAVLDRTKEPGALGEPLYEDVLSTLYEKGKKDLTVVAGRYGLSSKEFTPSMVKAVYDNLSSSQPKNHFTVGINDDVTFSSLEVKDKVFTEPKGTIKCKFWGLGSDGTVGANKNSIKIIGDHTDMHAQGYFSYDSKKSGGITISHLRFGPKEILSHYLITQADFIACHNQSYVTRYDLLEGVKEEGAFLLNCNWSESDLSDKLPGSLKRIIAQKKLDFYIIDATSIAEELGLGNRTNTILQSAFFKISKVIPDFEKAVGYMKDAIKKTYGAKGDKIVKMNCDAVDRGADSFKKVNVPADWANAELEKIEQKYDNEYVNKVLIPMSAQKGDELPVSAFSDDGSYPIGTTQYEKRGIAVNLPKWISSNCIQCNQCAFVCPHAVIRPYLVKKDAAKDAPEGLQLLEAKGKGFEDYMYKIQISPLDCTGCGSCASVCPSKEKSLVMTPFEERVEIEVPRYEFLHKQPIVDDLMDKYNLKGSQFQQPLVEFSGACAGCGETPYIKLITQWYGDRMIIANATGCTSIWGGYAPVCPYTTNKEGKGPAWANSLFEDNAEYGLGMNLAVTQLRLKLAQLIQDAKGFGCVSNELKEAFEGWLEKGHRAEESIHFGNSIRRFIKDAVSKASGNEKSVLEEIIEKSDYLVKKSIWIIGGDGWAYDIGFGGLDHVIASGQDINIIVVDTEVYSNTGGQSSKASQIGQVAKFAFSGKEQRKKDLGLMAMSYGYVYVASCSIGANKNQYIKALKEAEEYPGPSLLICYAPCINHGINMAHSINEEKLAVECGYWPLYRYNPNLKDEGKNPFVFESKEPNGTFQDFLKSEVRFSSLMKLFPDKAKELFAKAEKDMKERYSYYSKLAKLDFSDLK